MEFVYLFFIFFVTSMSRTQSMSASQGHHKQSLNYVKCTNDSNCALNAYCHSTGTCFCNDGYVASREPNIPGKKSYHTVCLREAKFIGDYCTIDVQCKATFGTHAICKHDDSNNKVGSCQCLKDAHYRDGLCYKTSLIGEMCEVNDNCLIKSKNIDAFCDVGRCICPPKYHPTIDGTDCQPSSDLGGPCIDNSGCMQLNSECRHGTCRCKHKYVSDDQDTYCLLLAEKLEDPCEQHDQCTMFLQNTRCNEERGVCVCESGCHVVNSSCWISANLLEPCSHDAECLIDKSSHGIECNSGICQCKDGYALEEQKYCSKVNNTERISSDAERVAPQMYVHGGVFVLMMEIILSAL